MRDKVSVLAVHLKRFWEYARLQNVSQLELFAAMKHASLDWDASASVITAADFYAVLEFIADSIQDDLLGIKIGEYHNLNTLGVIYQISMKATDLKEALFYCKSYLETTFPVIEEIQSSDGKLAVIELQGDRIPGKLRRIILECTLVIISREIKAIVGEGIELRIGSPYYQENYPAGWEKSDAFMINFELEFFRFTIPDQIRWQMDILLAEYAGMIASLHGGEQFSDKVKMMALNMAKPDLPDLKLLSGAFNLTPRTFQRRLAAEGNSYTRIMEGLKQKIAILLIWHRRFSITDISNILGYSEPTAFIRSFKNKYGSSPLQYRRKLNIEFLS